MTLHKRAMGAMGTACAGCHTHNDNGGNLAGWDDILVEHDDASKDGIGVCGVCHNYTDSDNKSTPPFAYLFGATSGTIDNNTNPTHCLNCHTPKATPASHGGHSAGNDYIMETPSCVTTDCHTGPDHLVSTHNNDCSLCHQDGTPGGTLINSASGRENLNPNYCIDCHTSEPKNIHHVKAHAQAGNCTRCHKPDPTKFSSAVTITMPKQLACVNCHVRWESADSSLHIDALSFTVGVGNTTVSTDVSSHTITSLSGSIISIYDFGACFACHADAAKSNNHVVLPFHGRPTGVPIDSGETDRTDNHLEILMGAPGHGTFNIMGLAGSWGFVDIDGNSFVDLRTPDQFYKGTSEEAIGKNEYKPLKGTWDTQPGDLDHPAGYDYTRATIPWDNYSSSGGGIHIEIPSFPDISPPNLGDSVTITTAEWDSDTNQVSVVATTDSTEGTVQLTATYKTIDHPMGPAGGASQSVTFNDNGPVDTIVVTSSEGGSDSILVQCIGSNCAVPDTVIVTMAEWNCTDTVTVEATTDSINPAVALTASYEGVNGQGMTDQGGGLFVTNFSEDGVVLSIVTVQSSDGGSNTLQVNEPAGGCGGGTETITIVSATCNPTGNGFKVNVVAETINGQSSNCIIDHDHGAGVTGAAMIWEPISSRWTYTSEKEPACGTSGKVHSVIGPTSQPFTVP